MMPHRSLANNGRTLMRPLLVKRHIAHESGFFVMPGKLFGTGTMPPIDYFVAMTDGRIPSPHLSHSSSRITHASLVP
jgi:hypothetical protein